MAELWVALALIPASSGLEPVVSKDKLIQDTEPLWHTSYHSLPSPYLPRESFIDQPKGEDEQLGEPRHWLLSARFVTQLQILYKEVSEWITNCIVHKVIWVLALYNLILS